MIQTEKLKFTYKDGPEFSFPDINVPNKENLLITGNSGVGKTTLLHLLAGIRRPKSGKVKINGTSLYELKSSELDFFRGNQIGVVFQQPHFVSGLTAFENIEIAVKKGFPEKNNHINKLVNRLGIENRASYKTNNLSLGEKQRLGIARAIVNKPQVLYADEPTASLDDKNASIVMELLLEEAEINNSQLVCITHDQRVKRYFKNEIDL
ncbi:ATP-binding cassette domain-containing protein [Mangrovivirga sp. M17]|uniref:ATP-binding cassette domain-containing protein n=1 Tax=Mangrovivirga halotolerans TaxID=2993936 RepID=A0ABT3RSI4_9BACT|nr:ATP-binding cassette domain-containing protein [Mangrovivirga halotolerans]MCX2744734.1 ATP-binding cassette domain-containing protein [Mangrovivirga halotolerans]